MYGAGLYSRFLYCSIPKSKSGGGGGGDFEIIGFNGYNFSDIIISNIPDDYAGNTLSLETYQLSTHGQGLGNRLIKNQTLTINGRIVAETLGSLEEIINKIKTNILHGQSDFLYLRNKLTLFSH